jgi:hypothetical protein
VIYNGPNAEKGKELRCLLKDFGFKNSFSLKTSDISSRSKVFGKNHVFVLFDDTDDYQLIEKIRYSKWLKKELPSELWELNKICGFLFINNTRLIHVFNDKKIECFGASNSGSSIYNNLMSLLHYKRYLNKSKK